LGGVRESKTLLSNIHIHGLKIDKKYAINCAWGIDAVGVSSGGCMLNKALKGRGWWGLR
jgi:hypothetical protein